MNDIEHKTYKVGFWSLIVAIAAVLVAVAAAFITLPPVQAWAVSLLPGSGDTAEASEGHAVNSPTGKHAINDPQTVIEAPTTILADFENGPDSWIAHNTENDAFYDLDSSREWAHTGNMSTSTVLPAKSPEVCVQRHDNFNLADGTHLGAWVHTGTTVDPEQSSITAKTFIQAGPSKAWYDGGKTPVTTGNKFVGISLKEIDKLHDVRALGVCFETSVPLQIDQTVYVDTVGLAQAADLRETLWQRLSCPLSGGGFARSSSESLIPELVSARSL